MKSLSLILLFVMGLDASANIVRGTPTGGRRHIPPPRFIPAHNGFECNFVTASGKKIKIAGFTEAAQNIPKKWAKKVWAGQAIAVQVGAADLLFDSVSIQSGRVGFAGQNVNIVLRSSAQTVQIKLVTGATGGPVGPMTVHNGAKLVASGTARCILL